MTEKETIGSFFEENKQLAKNYFNIRFEVYRLQLIRGFSKSTGYLLWIIISMILFSFLAIFAGLTIGFWLSSLTGSYVKGFGLTAMIILALIIIVALLRKMLFINPIIRNVIKWVTEETKNEKNN